MNAKEESRMKQSSHIFVRTMRRARRLGIRKKICSGSPSTMMKTKYIRSAGDNIGPLDLNEMNE
jgi:hypothetical protein